MWQTANILEDRRNLTSCVTITLFPDPAFPCNQRTGLLGPCCKKDLIFLLLSAQVQVPGYLFPSDDIESKIESWSDSSTFSQAKMELYLFSTPSASTRAICERLWSFQSRSSFLIFWASAMLCAFASLSINCSWRSKSSQIFSNRPEKRPQEVRNSSFQPGFVSYFI